MKSDDSSTDESKKRRASSESDNAFAKSLKVSRTPNKRQPGGDEKLDVIIKMLTDAKEDREEIKEEIKYLRTEQQAFKGEIAKLKEENENLKKKCEELAKENEETKSELREVTRTTEWLENDKRRKNVIMTGLVMDTDDPNVIKKRITDFLKEHLQIEVTLRSAIKLRNKTFMIKLNSESDKNMIMENKAKLKALKAMTVYINNDLTKNERNKQRQIREKAKNEKGNGKEVKVGYNKIIVDGELWKWNRDKRELEKEESKN